MEAADERGRLHVFALVAAWLVAALVAVAVGVVAVTALGGRLSDRGPQGDNELVRSSGVVAATPTPDPNDPVVEETFSSDFGQFVVACQGQFAVGIEALPDRSEGWRTISYEPGPDDDIDAVFSNGKRSQELEIYCNLGRPVLDEIENNTIPRQN